MNPRHARHRRRWLPVLLAELTVVALVTATMMLLLTNVIHIGTISAADLEVRHAAETALPHPASPASPPSFLVSPKLPSEPH
ncbi:hypothetical protein Ae717Ps2_6238 [Pseudonocardia sp. Ae717_Ps2]|uniref:hypothetical protein n=1 Tax=Pseudonocardia sp. Ae717_Ps2 TaxID=1885573 RepID=UPI0009651AF7|nr:hypothetical protein [Pseudonocardia sp. Ae717_Ps2]OLM28642.1 hypothetical protein Ae717Ps2_6238 [Pseudonocardia sp. Ae717_Ps2]